MSEFAQLHDLCLLDGLVIVVPLRTEEDCTCIYLPVVAMTHSSCWFLYVLEITSFFESAISPLALSLSSLNSISFRWIGVLFEIKLKACKGEVLYAPMVLPSALCQISGFGRFLVVLWGMLGSSSPEDYRH